MHPELADLDLPEPDALHLPGLTGVRDIKGRIGMWRALLDRPLTSYYLIIGITALLLGLGLVMVLSTSSVQDLAEGLPAYSDFKKQLLGWAETTIVVRFWVISGMFIALGLGVFYVGWFPK